MIEMTKKTEDTHCITKIMIYDEEKDYHLHHCCIEFPLSFAI